MSSEHSPVYLRDLIEVSPKVSLTKEKGYPFIDMAAVRGWQRDVPLSGISKKEFKGHGAKFEGGDILLARITPCFENGKTAVAPRLHGPGHGSTEFIVVRPRREQDRAFIYGVLRSPEFREYAIKQMVGTSGRQRIPHQALTNFKTELPNAEYRGKASKLLAAMEDLSTELRHQNAAAESIAQGIFRSWFVNFDPVHAKAGGKTPEAMSSELAELFPSEFEAAAGGEIPKGWSMATLDEVIELNPSAKLRKGVPAPFLEMSNAPLEGHRPLQTVPDRAFSAGSKFTNGDTLLARITPCLENGKTAFVDFLDAGQLGWGSTEFLVLRPRAGIPPYWVYLLARHEPFRQFAIQAMTGTSGRQRVDASRLRQFALALPPRALLQRAWRAIEPLSASIAVNDETLQALARLRDHLLPRMISGKLSLSLAEEAVQDVLAA